MEESSGSGSAGRRRSVAGMILGNPNNPAPVWPTIDGPLGLSEDDSLTYARNFFKFGFLLLPWLWAINCFFFWPVLRHSKSFPSIRRYVVGSAIGFLAFAVLLSSWAITFSVGGERLFGPVWDTLVMYNVADRYGLTDVVGSAIGFLAFAVLLSSWAITFSVGGERLFGPVWDTLVMYNVADRYGLTGWY